MKPQGRVNTWSPSTTLYSRIERADGTTAWCGILTIGVAETLKLFRSVRPWRRDRSRAARRARLQRFFAREQLALLRGLTAKHRSGLQPVVRVTRRRVPFDAAERLDGGAMLRREHLAERGRSSRYAA